jgi:CubicO group peptidase (beta-lactamase class C family)
VNFVTFLTTFSLLLIPVSLHYGTATKMTTDRLTMDLATFIEDEHLNEATVGVMRDGKLVYAQRLVKESSRAVDLQSPHAIPALSMSHLIACLAVLKLNEDGYVSLDDKVFGKDGLLSDYVKKKKYSLDARVGQVTLANLMQQTVEWMAKPDDWSRNTFPGDVITGMMTDTLRRTPGETFRFSILNEYLLRIIVEVYWETSYEDFVKQFIMVPLGMFHSHLSHQNNPNKNPMDLPKHLKSLSVSLLPSIWQLSVYDAMRLLASIDGSRSLLMGWNTLQLIYQRPKQPYIQHSDAWQGMGVFVKNDGSFWLESVVGTHYLFFYNSGSDLTRAALGLKVAPKGSHMSVLSYMQGDNLSSYKQDVLDLVFRVDSWPILDIIGGDLFDAKLADKALRYHISEHHFSAYASALKHAGYHPIWLSAYTNKGNTFFTVVTKKSNNVDSSDWVVEHGLQTKRYKHRVEKLEMEGYQLKITQNYICNSHSGVICHVILMFKLPEEQRVAYIHLYEHMNEYLEDAGHYYQNDYIPVTQSVVNRLGHSHVSAIMHRAGPKDYKPYIGLDLNSLETTIYKEAVSERRLHYLDPYFKKGQLLFSAVFKKGDSKRWMLQQDLKPDIVKYEVDKLLTTKYFPEIMVAYEVDGELYFTILYIMQ